MFPTGLIKESYSYPAPSNPLTFNKPFNLYLNLIHDISSCSVMGLHYVVISCYKERQDRRRDTGSMFNIILLLMCFPQRRKVTVRNTLCLRDFPLPVDSLNAPTTMPRQAERNNTDIHFSWRSPFQKFASEYAWTE